MESIEFRLNKTDSNYNFKTFIWRARMNRTLNTINPVFRPYHGVFRSGTATCGRCILPGSCSCDYCCICGCCSADRGELRADPILSFEIPGRRL